MKTKLQIFTLFVALLLTGVSSGFSQTTNLINFDLGSGPVQTGPAVVGNAGDFWNSGVATLSFAAGTTNVTVSSVNNSLNATLSGVQIAVDNIGSSFIVPVDDATATGGAMDATTTSLMEDGALATTTLNVTVSGLTNYVGNYFTFVVYGSYNNAANGGSYTPSTITMTAGATSGNSGSSLNISATNRMISSGIGVAYNTFTGTISNDTLRVHMVPSAGFEFLNGFQLQMVSPTVPIIATAPVSKTNVVGSTVTFGVTATGASPLSYQWQANGGTGFTNVPNAGVFTGATSNLLTLTSITTNQGLAYQVIVTNSYGAVTSTPAATLTVLTIPIITSQPISQSRYVGQAVSFNVGASGVGTLGYQWQATNSAGGGFTNLINGGQVSGAKSSTLYITSLTPNWARSYQVIVTNANGAVTSAPPVTLTVIAATNLINIDFDDLADGGSTQTGAAVLGSPGDIWNSESPTSGFFVYSAPGLTNSAGIVTPFALTLFAAGGADTGREFFPANTADAATTSLMADAVYSGAYLNLVLGGLSPGQKFNLIVYAAGVSGAGSVMQKYGGDDSTYTSATIQSNTAASQSIVAGPGVAYNTFTGIVGAGGAVILTISPQGDTNAHINGLQLQLTAPTDPQIVTGPVSQTNIVGATVSFNVFAQGTSPLNYQWQANGGTGFTNVPNTGVFSGATSNVLTLTGITTGQALTYQVIVSNINGVVTSTPSATLTITNNIVNSTNAYLNSLVLNPAGTLSPSFAGTTFGYTATEAYGNSPTVTVVPADATATAQLIYNGTTNVLGSGTPSAPLALTLGSPNLVTVQVTAQDAVSVQTYTVNVTEQPSLTLPKLTNSVVGGVFNLSWPADHLGYRLLVQTNNLAKGVSGNTNDWATVVGSTAVTATNFPVVTTNKNSYYRLVYP